MGSRGKPLRRTVPLAVTLLAVAILAACGTTVPQTSSLGTAQSAVAPTGQGLDQPGSTTADAGTDGAASPSAGTVATGAPTAAGAPAPGQSVTVDPVTGATTSPAGAARATPGTTARPAPGATAKATARSSAAAKTSAKAVASTRPTSSSGTATTAPLRIGFEYFDDASADAANAASGVSAQHSLTALATFQALITYENDHGGLGGRQVTVVPHSENDMSNNFASDAQAGCQFFTQDNAVPIVVDAAWGAGSGFNTCITKAGVEDVSSPQPPDATSLGATPFEVHPGNLTPDRAYSAALVQLVRTGALKAGTKIGVFMDNCSSTTAAYTTTIGPTLKKLGLVPDPFSTTCISGYGGLGGASTSAASAVLQFRGNDDTQVMMVSQNDSTYWVLFGAASGSQQYDPGLIMTSYSQANVVQGNLSAAQVQGIHGVGWIPVVDVANPKVPGTPVESQCDADLAAEQVSPTSNNDQYYVYTLCAPVLLLKAAFAVDGSNATAPVLSKAVASLGTTTPMPGIIGGLADFSHQDAPADVQVFGYQTSCSCLAYSGSPVPA